MQSASIPADNAPRRRVGAPRTGRPNKSTKTLRDKILGALTKVGGEVWLAKLAMEHPSDFAWLLAKLLPREGVTDLGNYTFIVQQLHVPAAPIPGVLNSPIAAHIDLTARRLGGGGPVIEAEQ